MSMRTGTSALLPSRSVHRKSRILPCIKCGSTNRSEKSGSCLSCKAARGRAYYEANKEKKIAYYMVNKEKIATQKRKYHIENREKRNAYMRGYIAKHRDTLSERSRKWYAQHKEQAKEQHRKWCQDNRTKVNSYASKYRATKLKAIPLWADLEEIKDFYAKCPNGYVVDHIIPLQGKNVCGLHVSTNLQYLTQSENCQKGNKF